VSCRLDDKLERMGKETEELRITTKQLQIFGVRPKHEPENSEHECLELNI